MGAGCTARTARTAPSRRPDSRATGLHAPLWGGRGPCRAAGRLLLVLARHAPGALSVSRGTDATTCALGLAAGCCRAGRRRAAQWSGSGGRCAACMRWGDEEGRGGRLLGRMTRSGGRRFARRGCECSRSDTAACVGCSCRCVLAGLFVLESAHMSEEVCSLPCVFSCSSVRCLPLSHVLKVSSVRHFDASLATPFFCGDLRSCCCSPDLFFLSSCAVFPAVRLSLSLSRLRCFRRPRSSCGGGF